MGVKHLRREGKRFGKRFIRTFSRHTPAGQISRNLIALQLEQRGWHGLRVTREKEKKKNRTMLCFPSYDSNVHPVAPCVTTKSTIHSPVSSLCVLSSFFFPFFVSLSVSFPPVVTPSLLLNHSTGETIHKNKTRYISRYNGGGYERTISSLTTIL